MSAALRDLALGASVEVLAGQLPPPDELGDCLSALVETGVDSLMLVAGASPHRPGRSDTRSAAASGRPHGR